MIKTPCPKSETLGKYVLGNMDASEMQVLERHLEECQSCCDQAETLNPTDEVTKAFSLPSINDGTDEEMVGVLIERVAKLHSATKETCAIDLAKGNTWQDKGNDHGASEVGPIDLLNPPQSPDELGRLGDYRVVKVLGSGGMGFVFLAEDERLRRHVALKVMKPSEARKKGAKERFLREARATAAVEHDNIIAIHQVGEDRGIPFIAMPMLQGSSLKTILEHDKRLSQRSAVSVARQIAAGLFAAHQTGLIHRDIKPDNLWIESTKSRVKILDFGLVRDLESEEGLTIQGTVMGTPSYMSPEQASGEPVDHRSDLFSLGVVLYQMLSGRSPYAGRTLTATLMNVARAQPTPIESLMPGLDPELIQLVSRMNARDPKDRPQSAGEVVQTLERIGARLASPQKSSPQKSSPKSAAATATLPTVRTQPVRKPPKTPRGKYVALGGIAASILLLAITFWVQIGKYNVQISLDDPSISLKIDGQDVLIDDGKAITRLSAGPHQLTVQRDGLSTVTDQFSVKKDGKNVIHVSIAQGRLKIDEGDVATTPEALEMPKVSSAKVESSIASASSSGSGSSAPEVRTALWLLSQDTFVFRLQSKTEANSQWEYIPGQTQLLPTEPFLIRSLFLTQAFTDEHQDASASHIAPHVQGIRDLFSLRINSSLMSSAGFANLIAIPEFSTVSHLELAGSRLDDLIFEGLSKLPKLIHVHFANVPRMTGEGISRLRGLEEVSWTTATPTVQSINELLDLPFLNGMAANDIKCTEQHAVAISKLKLHTLRLYGSKLNDTMLQHLTAITQLKVLDISNSEITDVGLRELQKLKALEYLDIRDNPITPAGLDALQKALPQCKIVFEQE